MLETQVPARISNISSSNNNLKRKLQQWGTQLPCMMEQLWVAATHIRCQGFQSQTLALPESSR